MKVEIYIPDHEEEVKKKILDLKAKRRLSQEVVNLLKGSNGVTEERVIDLIKQYAGSTKCKQEDNDLDILDSIKSVMGELK